MAHTLDGAGIAHGSVHDQMTSCTTMVALDVDGHVQSGEWSAVYSVGVGGVYARDYVHMTRARSQLTMIGWLDTQAAAALCYPHIQQENRHCYELRGNSIVEM